MRTKKYLSMIRPFDVIIVVGLLLASFIPYVIFIHQQAAGPVLSAVVTHDGKQVYKLKLTGHHGKTTYRYHDGHDWNTIVITNEHVAITSANCADQVCVRKGQIAKAGETIVCLPHKLLVEITSSKGTSTNTGGVVQ